MRWRLSGSDWQVVPSLTQLLVQADQAWPVRHGADGTKAGAAHATTSPNSDHNPDMNGDVRAADIGEVTEDDGIALAEAMRLSRDPRIKYVIHERRMFSSYKTHEYPPFMWRPYSGSNGHWSHVHASVLIDNQSDYSPWDIGAEGREDMAALQVEDLQEALVKAGQLGKDGKVIDTDGIWGPNTLFAAANGFRALQAQSGITEGQVKALIAGTALVPE